ncbi:MAG: hypothetical protein H0W65_09565 [Sphingomonas sp.]|uniref:lysozyme inhibitor LprI family protein n=1 Tax=Sphingomonas sp. TaxID=28214 RepID=UPI001799681A|nr:hypothetical protein [Sphingomonas sp.]MBA3667956.1 hypothetical protein [Sphingomonas sp.]
MRFRLVLAAAALALSACGDSDQDKLGGDLSAAEGSALTENEANFAEAAEAAPPPATIAPQDGALEETPLADQPDPLAPAPPRAAPTVVVPETGNVLTSFDCARARTTSERAVCASPALAALDRAMAERYVDATADADADAALLLRRTRGSFLAYRERCGSENSCIERVYRGRMREIEDIATGRWQPH